MRLTVGEVHEKVCQVLGLGADAGAHYLRKALSSPQDDGGLSVEVLQVCTRAQYPAATAVYDRVAACYRVLAHADSSGFALGLGQTEAGAWRDAARACLHDEAPALPAAGSPTQ